MNNESWGKTVTFTRYKKEDSTIALGCGQDPPAHVINPNYIRQPSNPRICEQCGCLHDCIIEDMTTGERLEELTKCNDCYFQ